MKREALNQIFELEDHHWWFRARRAIVQKVLDRYLIGRNKSILEVGCGSGGNFEMLSTYGSLRAVERDEEARIRAIDRNMANVEPGSLPDHLPDDRFFDLICLLDVLEHVEQDEKSLAALNDLLVSHGNLLLTVPAYGFLWSMHDEINQHKRRYTREQVLSLLRRTGFEPLFATYFNSVLFPIVAGVRYLKGRVYGKTGTDFKRHSRITNGLLFRVMALERHVMPRFSLPLGVSILVLAKKTSNRENVRAVAPRHLA